MIHRGKKVIVEGATLSPYKQFNGVEGIVSDVPLFFGRPTVTFNVNGQFVDMKFPAHYLREVTPIAKVRS